MISILLLQKILLQKMLISSQESWTSSAWAELSRALESRNFDLLPEAIEECEAVLNAIQGADCVPWMNQKAVIRHGGQRLIVEGMVESCIMLYQGIYVHSLWTNNDRHMYCIYIISYPICK